MDNMRKGRPSKAKQDRLIEYFVAGPTARCAAALVGINHSKLFADKQNHIKVIENFWNQAKRHMRKFNGVPKVQFGLYLKECEWRFNNSDPASQLLQLRQWVRMYLN